MENGSSNNLLDFKDEKDFITYKLKQRTRKKIVSKSITTTIKYEYKSLNNDNKNNKTNNFLNSNISKIRNEKTSALLRSHSRILNNMPYQNFFNKKSQPKIDKEQSIIPASNKGFQNFSLSKVCGSSHPHKAKERIIVNNFGSNNINDIIKKVEKKDIDNINNIDNNHNDSDCRFVKSYSLNYKIKQLYEEKETSNCININNNKYINKGKNIKNKENTNISNIKLYDNIKNNKKELLNNKKENSIEEIEIKKKSKINKSLSTNDIGAENYKKVNNYFTNSDNDSKKTINYKVFNENKTKIHHPIKILIANNARTNIKTKNKNRIFIPKEENKNQNEKVFENKNKNIINNILKEDIYKTFFYRNESNFNKMKKGQRSINNKILSRKKKENFNKKDFYDKYINNNSMYNKLSSSKMMKNRRSEKFLKKFGTQDKNSCVMPANSISTIISKNEMEFLNQINF